MYADRSETAVKKIGRWVVEWALRRRGYVKRDGAVLFSMRNYSRSTSMRIRRFFNKEPETLRWMDSFAPVSLMLDIGANVGSFSLYAASRGHRVLALEPDALNFALLNLNISDNAMNDRITAYPFAIHNQSMIAELNMAELNWGGAHKSFDRQFDWKGERMNVRFRQGSAGISVDDFTAQTRTQPDYIKIDVDGNELCVLQGAGRTLSAPALKGVLVELSEGHEEYASCMKILQDAGLVLVERAPTAKRTAASCEMSSENHVFARSAR
jgi:FkbM family methyltransferase